VVTKRRRWCVGLATDPKTGPRPSTPGRARSRGSCGTPSSSASPRKLLVAPFNLRKRLVDHIRRVATAAEAGTTARIRIKVNNLTDADIVEELYRASQVHIEIIVRAICTLVPGVPGLSENIHVRSVLNPDGSWDRTKPKKGERLRAAQAVFMRRRDRARRLARAH